jgi:hypothetical protein
MAQGPFGHVLRTVPVGDGGELGNMLVIGPPRRGKSDLLIGMGLDWRYNLIYNDPKKELAGKLGAYRGLLGNVFIFDPLSPFSHKFDPLRGRCTERQLTASATQLLYKPNEGDAEVFTQRAIKLLTLLFLAAREENQQAGYEKYYLLPYVREMLELGSIVLPTASTLFRHILQDCFSMVISIRAKTMMTSSFSGMHGRPLMRDYGHSSPKKSCPVLTDLISRRKTLCIQRNRSPSFFVGQKRNYSHSRL